MVTEKCNILRMCECGRYNSTIYIYIYIRRLLQGPPGCGARQYNTVSCILLPVSLHLHPYSLLSCILQSNSSKLDVAWWQLNKDFTTPGCIPSAPGLPQNPFKNHIRKRFPKAPKNDSRASKIDSNISRNRAGGPPAGISDAVSSIPDFRRRLHEFHGFSNSGASQNH